MENDFWKKSRAELKKLEEEKNTERRQTVIDPNAEIPELNLPSSAKKTGSEGAKKTDTSVPSKTFGK